MLILLTSLLILSSVDRGLSEFDPCLPGEHMDLPYPLGRTVNCESKLNNFCDNYLSPGWYKVNLKTPMPTTCVELNQCGSVFPIWMDGSIPAEGDGIVNRTACQRGIASCCSEKYPVKMKHCSSFFVYKLVTVSSCPVMYCFGEEGLCEETTTTTTTTTTATTKVVTEAVTTEAATTPEVTTTRAECGDWKYGVGCQSCRCSRKNTVSCSKLNGECSCTNGWTGPTCEVDVDECKFTDCGHHSQCVNYPGGFRCECISGYHYKEGPGCVEECSVWTYGVGCQSCECSRKNTVSCSKLNGECSCANGWTGPTCEEDIDECQFTDCVHHARCINYPGGYKCECENGYSDKEGHGCKNDKEPLKNCPGNLLLAVVVPVMLVLNVASVILTFWFARRRYQKVDNIYEDMREKNKVDHIYSVPSNTGPPDYYDVTKNGMDKPI